MGWTNEPCHVMLFPAFFLGGGVSQGTSLFLPDLSVYILQIKNKCPHICLGDVSLSVRAVPVSRGLRRTGWCSACQRGVVGSHGVVDQCWWLAALLGFVKSQATLLSFQNGIILATDDVAGSGGCGGDTSKLVWQIYTNPTVHQFGKV